MFREVWEVIVGIFWILVVISLAAALVMFLGNTIASSEWRQQQRRDLDAQFQADAQPRVIREFDGCQVWAFKPSPNGHWSYVTKCKDRSVTTDSGHTERRGKSSVEVREITTTKEN